MFLCEQICVKGPTEMGPLTIVIFLKQGLLGELESWDKLTRITELMLTQYLCKH